MNDIVYMKRDIKSHRIYEKHPNLMFGIIILIWGMLFFFSMFSMMDNMILYWGILFIMLGLSGGKNLPEILLGYYQHHGGNHEYSYRNLFRRIDKICHSDKPHCIAASGTCGLYRNPMLCERLAGRTRILLKPKEKQEDFVKYHPVFLKQTIDCFYIRFSTIM